MNAIEVLDTFENSNVTGLQLSKKIGILSSTWLIYLKDNFFYYFDINDQIEFSNRYKYSKTEFIEDFKNAYFEIDCEA